MPLGNINQPSHVTICVHCTVLYRLVCALEGYVLHYYFSYCFTVIVFLISNIFELMYILDNSIIFSEAFIQ